VSATNLAELCQTTDALKNPGVIIISVEDKAVADRAKQKQVSNKITPTLTNVLPF
jgi:hypothetical protein